MKHTFDPAAPIMRQLRAIGLPEHLPAYQSIVYRFLDAGNRVLYIGVTVTPRGRWQAHKQTAKWWPQVQAVVIKFYPHERAALDAEVAAIKQERPLFNRRSAHAPLMNPARVSRESRMRPSPTILPRVGVGGGGRGEARILYLTGAVQRPVDNPTALPLAMMRARGAQSCQ